MTEARSAFVQLALERARAHAGIELALPHPDDLAIDVVPRQGATFRLTLHTLFVSCQDRSPAARAEAVDRRLDAALTPAVVPAAWAAAAPRLRTVLRAASSLGPDLGGFVARPALPGLIEAAVIDHEHAVLFVRAEHARAWGREPSAVLDVGRQRGDPPNLQPWDEPAGLWCSDAGTDGAQLLRAEALTALQERLGGPIVVALPHAHLLLVARQDPTTTARLARTAGAEYDAAGGPVSPCLYAGTPLTELRVERAHPAFEALERARVQLWVDEVSATAAARGVELELAAARGDDGRLRTALRWQALDALPEAEVVLDGPAPSGERVPGTWPPWRVCAVDDPGGAVS